MTRNSVFALCLFFIVPLISLCQEKWSKVRIPIPTPAVRQYMMNNLELDHFDQKDGYLTAVLESDELRRLKTSGYKYEVLINDVVSYTTEYNARMGSASATAKAPFQYTCGTGSSIIRTPALFGTGGSLRLGASSGFGYFKYTEMVTSMQALASAYPTLARLETVGTSENGTVIYGLKISDNVTTEESEPKVLYTALQHAREAIGGTSMIFFMQYLIENYSKDSKVKGLVDSRELFIIPCVNVDGYAYNYSGVSASYPATGGGLWRKNRRLISGTTYGVDLNRNYGVDWGNCTGATTSCGTSDPTRDTYYGPDSLSEKETRAIRSFVYKYRFNAAIDQHCYGPYYSLPFGRPSLHTMSTLDSYFYSAIPALMGTYNCHRAGNSPETVNYEVAGGIKDWLLMGSVAAKGKVYGMTGEAGGDAFWAPISQIEELCQGLCFQNIQLAYSAGSYFNLEDNNGISVTATTGNFGFTVRNIGLTVNPVTVSLVPIEGLQTVGSSLTTTLSTYNNTYSGNINYTLPATVQSGQRIRYAWKWESGGITHLDTVVKIYNPITLLSDDMEGSIGTNWSVGGGSASNKWGFTTGAAYSGTSSMTESTSGNYPASSTRTVTYGGTFDLSNAANAYLSFWVKHRSENCRDKLQVQFSTDGTNYTAICGTHTVSETEGTLAGQPALTGIRENWTRETYDLSAYKGDPSVFMRFQFTSDADGDGFAYETDDGFYIDNVEVVKTTFTATILGVKFLRFDAKLQGDKTVRLDWEATVDTKHDHFQIERSADGIHFVSLGKSNPQPPYKFIDTAPLMGANHYRIRQVDKDGKVTYSNTVLVEVKHQLEWQVFPNPVVDILQLAVRSTKPELVRFAISDQSGRIVHQQSVGVEATTATVKISVRQWSAAVYILKLYAADGTVLSTQKIVKL